jgi:hypothetical protein
MTRPAPIAGDWHARAVAAALDDPGDQQLLELLAGYADAGANPSVRALAALAGTDVAEVDRRLDRLIERGLLLVKWAGKRRRGPGRRHGRSTRNAYVLVFGEEHVALEAAWADPPVWAAHKRAERWAGEREDSGPGEEGELE